MLIASAPTSCRSYPHNESERERLKSFNFVLHIVRIGVVHYNATEMLLKWASGQRNAVLSTGELTPGERVSVATRLRSEADHFSSQLPRLSIGLISEKLAILSCEFHAQHVATGLELTYSAPISLWLCTVANKPQNSPRIFLHFCRSAHKMNANSRKWTHFRTSCAQFLLSLRLEKISTFINIASSRSLLPLLLDFHSAEFNRSNKLQAS